MKPTYEMIHLAVKKEQDSLELVLEAYNSYIVALSTYPSIDEYGMERICVDQDAIQTLRKKLIEEIPKWKEICK